MTNCILPSALPAQAASADKFIAAALQPFVDSHSLAGAVALVADKNGVLEIESVGWGDVTAKKPMKTNDLFWIASQSKPITVAAFMMLVDEGKVSLDDPVEKYLLEFLGQWLAVEHDDEHMLLRHTQHRITVRNILSHTSGLPFSSAMEQPTLDALPLKTAVRSYAMAPLQYEPESKYQYSNAGINTAGRIIEVVSGMPYEDFLQKRLFDPLNMKDTTFWPTKAQQKRLAKPYAPNEAKNDIKEMTIGQLHYPLDDRAVRFPMPAGGLFSTAEDCARFCRMLLNDGELDGKRYISHNAVVEMTKRQTAPGIPESYGLGLGIGGGWFGHGGAFSTNMTVDTNRGLVKVWLVQHAGFPGNGQEAEGAFNRVVDRKWGKR